MLSLLLVFNQLLVFNHHHGLISSLSEPRTSTTLLQEPTKHEIHCKSSVEGWDNVREGIRMVVTEEAAMDEEQLCLICGELACLRCECCGPGGFFLLKMLLKLP